MAGPDLTMLEQIAGRDRVAGVYLCAWHSERARELPAAKRSDVLAALAPLAAGATQDEIEGAKRYALARNRLVTLAQRRKAVPPGAAELVKKMPKGDHRERGRTWRIAGIVVGAVACAAGFVVAQFEERIGMWIAFGGFGAFMAFAFPSLRASRLAEADAQASDRALGQAKRAEHALRELEGTLDAVKSHGDVAYLRELVVAHPDLAFPELSAADV